MAGAGNIDLLYHDGRLLLAADQPEGWSIRIGVVGQDSVDHLSQVIDDRRNTELRWSYPTLAPLGSGKIALLWQGPSMAITSLYFLAFDREGHALGQELTLEGRMIDESSNRVIGRAPVFQPALAPAANGLLAAFSDNRYANSEILLASFSCTEQP